MDRADLVELHYITPIVNLRSIVQHGIVCKRRATGVNAVSIAMEEVQALRASKQVPGGLTIHEYACLYFNCRNPMMYSRHHQHETLCVLSVDPKVLDLPGAVVTDQNAASKWARFAAAPGGLAIVNQDRTFAQDWTHPGDQIEEWRHKSAMCAEVLVPGRIAPEFILGSYVSCAPAAASITALGLAMTMTANARLFFR